VTLNTYVILAETWYLCTKFDDCSCSRSRGWLVLIKM